VEFVFGADIANELIQFQNTVEEANINQPLESTGPVEFVHIEADRSNTDVVFIGNSEVNASTGFPLKRGASMGMVVSDSALVYVVSPTANQVVHVTGGGFHLDDPPVSDIVATGGTISTYTQDNGVQFRVHTFTGVTIFDVTEEGWADVLMVGGGGGGGADGGGGGGGGGVMLMKRRLFSAEPYQVIVGGGGAGAEYPFVQGTKGTNSSIVQQADLAGQWPELGFPFKEIAKFGGGGGGGETGDRPSNAPEDIGDGSPANGGGGGQPDPGTGVQGITAYRDGSFNTGHRTIAHDGFKGGDHGDTSTARSGGGGAGSAANGEDGPSGHGGKGIQLRFTNEWVSFGGGGGGAGESSSSGYGTGGAAGDGGQGGGGGGGSNRGSGTGGAGGADGTNNGGDGSSASNTNTTSGGSDGGAGGQFSGGGGGAGSSGRGDGGNGGSGTVIIKYRIV